MNRSSGILPLVVLGAIMALAPTAGSASRAGTQDAPIPAVATSSAFGPRQFTRTTAAPQHFTETFDHCGSGACQLIVTNGNPDGTNRVSSATVFLNGAQLLGPSDFKRHVPMIAVPVLLAEHNTLEVTIASKPGGFVTVAIECATSPADLSAGPPGASLLDPTTLSLALPINNQGSAAAENVQIAVLDLAGGTLASPVLPFTLGTIAAGGSAVLNASFTGSFAPLQPYALVVEGTYTTGDAIACFTLTSIIVLPPDAPGSAILESVTIEPEQVTGAPFPPRAPDLPERVNPAGWTVPTGAFVPGTPDPSQTQIMAAPSLTTEGLVAPPILFTGNRGVGISGSTTAEPSGASGGGVVFMTSNWFAAFSTNDGGSWTQLDPTTVFPNDAVGFCCDQIVQYAPSIDRFIWLLQGNGYRLAMASPAQIINSNGTAWTYWNLTPQVFGQPAGTGLDYPDLALGNNSLYMCWDAGAGCPSGCTSGFQVVRTALAGIQAGGTITVEFTNPANGTMAWGSHISQDTGDEVFWAGHRSNSQMRIFSLKEGSNTYFWRDRNVSSWPNNAPTSLTPDNRDWLAKNFNGPNGNSFPRNGVIGATRVYNQVWFAWTVGTNSFFQQAHIEMVAFNHVNNYNKDQQVQIWNNDYAFAYPALSQNFCSGEVGMSFEYGGNGNYENHVVGFWGDYIAYITSSSNVGTTRFGDYVTIRRRPPTEENRGNLFDAFGYGLRSAAGGGTTVDIRYVTFGRPASSCIIIEGAELATESHGTLPGAGGPAVVHDLSLAISQNPMVRNGSLRLNFSIPARGPARLRVYDASGALVRTLFDGEAGAGGHTVMWAARTDREQRVAPGVYFVSLDAAGERRSARVIVLP